MKIKGVKVIVATLAVSFLVFALEANKNRVAKTGDPRYDSATLLSHNKKHISRLAVMIRNFGSSEHPAQLEKLKANYRTAAKVYYRGEYAKSHDAFTSNLADIRQVYKDLSVKYRSRCEILLSRLQEKLISDDFSAPAAVGDEAIAQRLGRDTMDIARRNFKHGYASYQRGDYSRSISYYRLTKAVVVRYLVDYSTIEHTSLITEYRRDIDDAREVMFKKPD